MSLTKVVFGEEQPLASFYFASEHGWPVVGPFASLELAGAMLAWIRAHLAGSTVRGTPQEPSTEDVARFERLWQAAVAGRVRVRVLTGRVRGRRWVRGGTICDAIMDLDPGWRSDIERAIGAASRAPDLDDAEPDQGIADVDIPVGARP